jgi:branched-chain amino acid transport system permease protein
LDTLLGLLPQVLYDGLMVGFIYAMIALGYTMVYGVLEMINFAHSEIFMIGAVVGVEVFRILGPILHNEILVLLVALILGGLISGYMAVGVERFAYRPLRKRGSKNRLVPLITAFGVSFVLQDVVRIIEGLWHNEFMINLTNATVLTQPFVVWGVTIQYKSLILVGVSLLMLAVLSYLVNKTRLGLAIRAVAQDPVTAGLMGINPEKIISRTFLIGGALGGVAGVLFALELTSVTAYSGFLPGLRAFTAAVLGGIGNIPGAVVGGLVIGEIETLAGTLLPTLTGGAIDTGYKDVITFLILIMLLLFRPQGLLGQVVKEKV